MKHKTLPKSAWCIDNPVLQLLKPSVNEQQLFYNLQPFVVTVGGEVVLITNLFKPTHNYYIPTDRELCEISWLAIRALTNDLHFLKSRVLLPRFPWCIGGPVLQLLIPSIYCRSAKSPIRKCGRWRIPVFIKIGDQ